MTHRTLYLIALVMLGMLTVVEIGVFEFALKLATSSAPQGVVSLEVAGSVPRASEIIASWERSGLLERAFTNLHFDYFPFIPSYTAFVGLAAWGVRDLLLTLIPGAGKPGRLGLAIWWAGTIVAWGQVGTAICDYTENFGIGQMLSGWVLRHEVSEPWPLWAALFAWGKIAALAFGLAYSILGLVVAGVVALFFRKGGQQVAPPTAN